MTARECCKTTNRNGNRTHIHPFHSRTMPRQRRHKMGNSIFLTSGAQRTSWAVNFVGTSPYCGQCTVRREDNFAHKLFIIRPQFCKRFSEQKCSLFCSYLNIWNDKTKFYYESNTKTDGTQNLKSEQASACRWYAYIIPSF